MDPSTDVDRVLESLGGVGKYQIFQLSLLFIIMLENAFHLIAANYVSYRPDYRCDTINKTNFILQYTNLELFNISDISVDYGKCEVNVHVNTTGTKYDFSKSCPNGYHYDIRRDQSTVSEWDLVCDNAARSELAQTMIMMGQGLGAAIFSPLSDRFGRKPINILARVLYIIAGVTAMFSPSIAVFSVYRLLIGTFQQGSVITGSTILAELLPTKNRHNGEGLAFIAWTTGIVLTSIIGYICRDLSWRMLQLVLGLLSWHVVIDWMLFDDSLRWLVANGKLDKAEKIIKRSAKWNGKSYDTVMESIQKKQPLMPLELEAKAEDNGKFNSEWSSEVNRQNKENESLNNEMTARIQKYSVLTILKHKKILQISLLLWVCWITNTMTYYGLMLTTSKLAGDRYINNILASLSEFPSLFFQQFLINRIGRRYTLVFYHALAGVTLIIATVCHTYSNLYSWLPPLSTFFSIVGRFAAVGSFSSIFLYTPELYPTNLRNVGLGMSSAISRIGSMISPFAALLADYVFWGPAVIFASLNSIVTVILLTFPETMGRELPTTVEEMKIWFKGRKGIFDVEWPSTYKKITAKKTYNDKSTIQT